MSDGERQVGQTKDTGFQIGVRRTLPLDHEDAWNLLLSPRGQAIWLGAGSTVAFERGATFRREDGTTGEVRVVSPLSHLRMTWQPPGWERASTIQVRVLPNGARTTIAFHQEHLPGPAEREERRAFFEAALNHLKSIAEETYP